MPPIPCPCGSGRTLTGCCGPYLDGLSEPPDAEALMRSRYSAFATGKVEHLVRTLDAEHPDLAGPRDKLLLALRRTCRLARWRGLQIIDSSPPDAAGLATVTFRARLFREGRDLSFSERSTFRHDGRGWRYLRGEEPS